MDNQTSSVNPRDEWVEFPTQDEPFGESETNGGDFRLTEKPRNACQLIPETESKSTAISIAGKSCVAQRTTADGGTNV